MMCLEEEGREGRGEKRGGRGAEDVQGERLVLCEWDLVLEHELEAQRR